METEIQFWLSDKEIEEIYSSKFWNDEELEKGKEWYIIEGEPNKIIRYLQEQTTYYKEYESILKFSDKIAPIKGIGLDLAAGVCWSTALLSNIKSIDKIYAVEISKHRLLKIAPSVLDLFNADNKKIVRAIGSFYDIRLPDKSVDFCFLSQTFHHARNPFKLLLEIKRVLKSSGTILIIGEKPIHIIDFCIKYFKNLLKIIIPYFSHSKSHVVYKFFPLFKELFSPDMESGDHYYRIQDYMRIFKQAGLYLYINKTREFTTFLAIKN